MKEAGLPFAVATYSFIVMVGLTIVVGVIRAIAGNLPIYDPAHMAGTVPVHQGNGLVMGATILVLLRAFANGGSSLTGVEAISNTVDYFRKPQGRNARRVLTAMATILGILLAGVAYLAHVTHATPYLTEYPSVLSQIGRAVFGNGVIGARLLHSGPGCDRRHLVHRCEYQFQRIPGAGQFRRRGPLPAAPTHQTRSPPGLFERHHHPDGTVGAVAGR